MERRGFHNLCLAATAATTLLLAPAAGANDTGIEEQRRAYETARLALRRGDLDGYRRMEPQVADYALYPYLRYEYLRRRLGPDSDEEVHSFLGQFPDTPVADQLRRSWLERLARAKRWDEFLADYRTDLNSDELRCRYVDALIATGATEQAWHAVDALWLSAKSQPDECNDAFAAWRKADQMTRDKVLARMELALERNQRGLVSYLSELLPKSDRKWVQRWQHMHRSPEAELKRLTAEPDPEWSSRLFVYGVRRLASQDAEAADRYWSRRAEYSLTAEQVSRAERAVALHLTMQRHVDGHRRLAALAEAGTADRDMRQWRVRGALWHQEWEQVVAAVDGLTLEEQVEEDWQYWRARALEALGRNDEAQVFYHLAAQHRSFYGFLAAARVNRAPHIVSEPLDVTAEELAAMEQLPAMRRVREFTALGMNVEARREWRDALGRMDARTLRVAAKMAHAWGWYDQAILALGRTDYLDDLEVRFPTPFRDEVESYAEKRNIDPAFVYAVMRQESAFGVQARSHVGALGLMQLMPATAKRTARSIKERAPSRAELLTAEKNIRIGTAYLSELLEKYRGNRFFALAAYNAGPQRVTRWQPHAEPIPADIWVANVTFGETREYIERILAYTAVYERRLGRTVTPVTDWLADAPPRVIREASNSEPKTDMAQVTPPG